MNESGEQSGFPPHPPADRGWRQLRAEAGHCVRCPLHGPATQTVFGDGPVSADIVFVGEQPGDAEDVAGKPFVGPAGSMLDKAMGSAGIDRSRAYVTNAVKHFKFEQRGKRRLHKRPNAYEIERCHWWLGRELDLVRPRIVVAMGATAARSLAGRPIKVLEARGEVLDFHGWRGFVTVHPSFLLRMRDRAAAAREFDRFVGDLRLVGKLAARGHAA